MPRNVDEEFCRCVIEELRDGETVTVQADDPEGVFDALVRLGATEEELLRLTIEGHGRPL